MKIMHGNCGLINEYERDLRSSEHYLSSSENKAWKVQAIRDLNPWTLEYHCSALPTELMGFSYIHFTGLLRTDIMTSSQFLMRNSYKWSWLSCIHSHLFITSRVYYEAKIMTNLQWSCQLCWYSTALVSQRSWVQIPSRPSKNRRNLLYCVACACVKTD